MTAQNDYNAPEPPIVFLAPAPNSHPDVSPTKRKKRSYRRRIDILREWFGDDFLNGELIEDTHEAATPEIVKWKDDPFCGMTLEEFREDLKRFSQQRTKQAIADCDLPGCLLSEDGTFVKIRCRVTEDGERFWVDVLIDRSDLERVYSLRLQVRRQFGILRVLIEGGKPTSSLGRFILNLDESVSFVQYKNGDRLDNRRANLRLCGEFKKLRPSVYYGQDWPKMREFAMERANCICERCKTSPAVHVHHRLPVRFFDVPNKAHFPDNLKAVCRKCHRKEHREIAKRLPLFNEMLRSWRLK